MNSEIYKFLLVNHTRKKYHYSNSINCYCEVDKHGKELTTPREKFSLFSGIEAQKKNIPLGYTKFEMQ